MAYTIHSFRLRIYPSERPSANPRVFRSSSQKKQPPKYHTTLRAAINTTSHSDPSSPSSISQIALQSFDPILQLQSLPGGKRTLVTDLCLLSSSLFLSCSLQHTRQLSFNKTSTSTLVSLPSTLRHLRSRNFYTYEYDATVNLLHNNTNLSGETTPTLLSNHFTTCLEPLDASNYLQIIIKGV